MKEIGNKVKTEACWNNQGRPNHCQHWGYDRWENWRGKQDMDVKLVGKGCWNTRKNLQNQESVNTYQLAGFTALPWFYGRSPQCFLTAMMGDSIGSRLGKSCCQWIHITLKAAVSKEKAINPNSGAGSWGCHGLIMLIPCRWHLLQEAAFYRVNNVMQTLKWQNCHKTKWRFQQSQFFKN